MKTMLILTSIGQIKNELRKGHDVHIGTFQIFTKDIAPTDKLVLGDKSDRFVQVGVERKGISFDVSEFDIQYELDAYGLLLSKSETQSGGNACFVFFQYTEPSKWYPHCNECGDAITNEAYAAYHGMCSCCFAPSADDLLELKVMEYELSKTRDPSWCEFPGV